LAGLLKEWERRAANAVAGEPERVANWDCWMGGDLGCALHAFGWAGGPVWRQSKGLARNVGVSRLVPQVVQPSVLLIKGRRYSGVLGRAVLTEILSRLACG